ncbi:MAG: hypothetical protein ABJA32_10375, partial [Ginsengibacter sp.]
MDNNFHSSQKRTIVLNIAYFLLFIGFAMFVGCIMCCIVMNAIINKNATVASFYYERLFQTQMVYVLTIPGMWMMSASGLFIVFKKHEGLFRRNRAGLIQILSILILINGTFILTPLVRKVTLLASE